MKILITGATGFIGSNLTKRLASNGYDISCLVRSTSDISVIRDTGARIVTGDILEKEGLARIFGETGADIVFHCAARVINEHPRELFASNVTGTRNVCAVCAEHGVKRLIYLSSVSVVSGNTDVPLTDDMAYRASNLYGESKIEAEIMVYGYRKKGLHTSIIRPCMVYGEGEPHMLGNILKGVFRHRMFIPDLPGMLCRLNLVYIDNVIDVLELAMKKDEALDGTFIVADNDIITIRKFFEILYNEMDGSYPPVIPRWIVRPLMMIPFVKRKAQKYLKDRVYDISRLRNMLDYVPKISTEEGLRRTVRAWKKNRRSRG